MFETFLPYSIDTEPLWLMSLFKWCLLSFKLFAKCWIAENKSTYSQTVENMSTCSCNIFKGKTLAKFISKCEFSSIRDRKITSTQKPFRSFHQQKVSESLNYVNTKLTFVSKISIKITKKKLTLLISLSDESRKYQNTGSSVLKSRARSIREFS